MAASRQSLQAAALFGAVSGMRTFAGPAALALRGRPQPAWARGAILALAASEAVVDKLPIATPRSDPPGLAGRIVAGATLGALTAGWPGAGIGATTAAASTFACERARAALVRLTGLPDPAVAVAEDTLAYGGAWLASAP